MLGTVAEEGQNAEQVENTALSSWTLKRKMGDDFRQKVETFAGYADKLADNGLLSLSYDHHHVKDKVFERQNEAIGIELQLHSDDFKRTSCMLKYEAVDTKKVRDTVMSIRNFCNDYGLLKALNDGRLPLVSDGALTKCSEELTFFYSYCQLHSLNRLQERVITLLERHAPDLHRKYLAFVDFFRNCRKEKTVSEMQGLAPEMKSVNIYLKLKHEISGFKSMNDTRFRYCYFL